MGLIKAAIVLAIGFFLMSALDTQQKRIKELPFVGEQLYEKVNKNKDTTFIILIALLHLFL
jgi:hypothetical protein